MVVVLAVLFVVSSIESYGNLERKSVHFWNNEKPLFTRPRMQHEEPSQVVMRALHNALGTATLSEQTSRELVNIVSSSEFQVRISCVSHNSALRSEKAAKISVSDSNDEHGEGNQEAAGKKSTQFKKKGKAISYH